MKKVAASKAAAKKKSFLPKGCRGDKKLREFLEEFHVSYADFGEHLGVTRTSVLRWMTEGRPELPRAAQIERLTYGHVKVTDWYLASEIATLEKKATWQAEAASLVNPPPAAETSVTPALNIAGGRDAVEASSPPKNIGETPHP